MPAGTRVYFELAKQTFRRKTAYLAATAAGVFTNTVFGFLLAYVLLAVYEQRSDVGGFDPVDAVTFTFVAQGLLLVVGLFGDNEIVDRIRTGEVISDLSRPVDYQAWWAAAAYGRAAFNLVFRGVPPFIVGALAFDLRLPAATTWPWFLLSVTVAVAVGYSWKFLLSLTGFWVVDGRGAAAMGWVLSAFLSGMYVPLVFLPDGLASVARALPFAAMLQLPVEVFLGKHPGAGAAGVVALQVAWGVALLGLGRLVLARAVRRVVVNGG
ncbi:MAG: ABC-2 family transporter protein [Acidimicrobiales bacterium]